MGDDRWDRYDGDLLQPILHKSTTPSLVTRGKFELFVKKMAGVWMPVMTRPFSSTNTSGIARIDGKQIRLEFSSEDERDAALAILSSRIAWLWWQAIGDDFDVTQWFMELLPGIRQQAKGATDLAKIGKAVSVLMNEGSKGSIVTNRTGRKLENFDNRQIMDVTDRAVKVLLGQIGLADRWDEFEAIYWRAMKVKL
jgi:hypothetical protein